MRVAFGGIAFGVNPTMTVLASPAAFRKAVRRFAEKPGAVIRGERGDQPTASYQCTYPSHPRIKNATIRGAASVDG